MRLVEYLSISSTNHFECIWNVWKCLIEICVTFNMFWIILISGAEEVEGAVEVAVEVELTETMTHIHHRDLTRMVEIHIHMIIMIDIIQNVYRLLDLYLLMIVVYHMIEMTDSPHQGTPTTDTLPHVIHPTDMRPMTDTLHEHQIHMIDLLQIIIGTGKTGDLGTGNQLAFNVFSFQFRFKEECSFYSPSEKKLS